METATTTQAVLVARFDVPWVRYTPRGRSCERLTCEFLR